MFRSDAPINYEEVYNGLRADLGRADYRHAMLYLGARDAGERVVLELLGRKYLVGPDGVSALDRDNLDFKERIVLAYYLLRGGNGTPADQWVSYRDFKDGAFFHAAFSQIVETKIAQDFSGNTDRLVRGAQALQGQPLTGLGGDFCYRFPALPKIPLALVYYDSDEEFPASARVLYDQTAPLFLDMECLAVLGLILADRLAEEAG